jgi:hypothetical protein
VRPLRGGADAHLSARAAEEEATARRSAAATALRGAADGRAIPDSYYDHSNYKPLLEP